MLYLIKDSKHHRTLIKIGITSNIKTRVRQYKTHNPCARFLQLAEVQPEVTDSQAEKECHDYLWRKGYRKILSSEWFIVPKGQRDYFFEDIQADELITFRFIEIKKFKIDKIKKL